MGNRLNFIGFFGVLLPVFLGNAAFAGLCSMDKTVPGLPKASCQMPSCPAGIDCQAPQIDRNGAKIAYAEPLIRWEDICSEPVLANGPCWQVFLDFKAEFDATDAAGIASAGVNLAQEVSARRIFKKLMASVTTKGASGKWEIKGTMTAHVPPGQRLDIDVYGLCARDNNGNEACALPFRRQDLNLNGAANNAQAHALNLDAINVQSTAAKPALARMTAEDLRKMREASLSRVPPVAGNRK